MMNTAAATVENIADVVLRRELAHIGQCLRGLARRGCKIVIEGEHNPAGVGNGSAGHRRLEHLHHEIGAQIVHDHQVEFADDYIVGRHRRLARFAGEYFLDDVHSNWVSETVRRQVSP